MHNSTIKSKVNQENQNVDIIEIKKHSWGMFTVKVKQERTRSTKFGLIMGDWNQGDVKLEKIDWL